MCCSAVVSTVDWPARSFVGKTAVVTNSQESLNAFELIRSDRYCSSDLNRIRQTDERWVEVTAFAYETEGSPEGSRLETGVRHRELGMRGMEKLVVKASSTQTHEWSYGKTSTFANRVKRSNQTDFCDKSSFCDRNEKL